MIPTCKVNFSIDEDSDKRGIEVNLGIAEYDETEDNFFDLIQEVLGTTEFDKKTIVIKKKKYYVYCNTKEQLLKMDFKMPTLILEKKGKPYDIVFGSYVITKENIFHEPEQLSEKEIEPILDYMEKSMRAIEPAIKDKKLQKELINATKKKKKEKEKKKNNNNKTYVPCCRVEYDSNNVPSISLGVCEYDYKQDVQQLSKTMGFGKLEELSLVINDMSLRIVCAKTNNSQCKCPTFKISDDNYIFNDYVILKEKIDINKGTIKIEEIYKEEAIKIYDIMNAKWKEVKKDYIAGLISKEYCEPPAEITMNGKVVKIK